MAALVRLPGDYFHNTGNQGLIYHHMDLLAEYLAGHHTDRGGTEASTSSGEGHDTERDA